MGWTPPAPIPYSVRVLDSQPPVLREFQRDAIQRLRQSIARGHRSPLLVAPTGAGKTICAADIARTAVAKGNHVHIIAPRRELIDQTCQKLDDAGLGCAYGVIMADDRRKYSMAQIQVCSIDTLRSRLRKPTLVANPSVVIIDEAHLYVTPKRIEVLNQWPNAIRIGMTATPIRFDGVGLSELFDDIINVASVAELIDQGYLVPASYYSLSEPDLARVGIRMGDYELGELADVMGDAKLIGDTVREWIKRASDRRTAVFAVNRAHSKQLCMEFNAAGVLAEHVDGSMPHDERARIISDFRAGTIQVLCNCQIVQYGFDLPALDCIVLARPTRSLALYLQMLGRGMRPEVGKQNLLVLDHSGATILHGFADQSRAWTLEGRSVKEAKETARKQPIDDLMKCPQCGALFKRSPKCPMCGHFRTVRAKPVDTLDGTLVQLEKRPLPVELRRWYLELLGYALERKYSPGWAWHKYREKFGKGPSNAWRHAPPLTPSAEVRGWIKSRMIAYHKRRA